MNDVVYQPKNIKTKQGCNLCKGGYSIARPLEELVFGTKRLFLVVCDTKPTAPGHVLIVPQEHTPCIGALDEDLPEFAEKFVEVVHFLESMYGPVIAFEHGVTGQTILHAHMNLLPFPGTLADIVPESDMVKEIAGIAALEKQYDDHGKYLYLYVQGKHYLINPKLSETGFFHKRLKHALQENYREHYSTSDNKAELVKQYEKDIDELFAKWDAYHDKPVIEETEF